MQDEVAKSRPRHSALKFQKPFPDFWKTLKGAPKYCSDADSHVRCDRLPAEALSAKCFAGYPWINSRRRLARIHRTMQSRTVCYSWRRA